jgi:hypothetical protein
MARTFAPDDQFASLPINVIQGHEHDLAGAQPEAGQNEQDCEIALAGGGPLITLPEQSPHLVRRQ